MANKLVTQFKSLPKYGQVAIVVGGVAILYFAYKRFLATPTTFSKDPKKLRTERDIENQGNTLPYNPTPYVLDYQDMAKKIFDAMDGLGTYFNDIKTQVNELRNQKDWNELQKAYGVRTLTSGYYFNKFKGNLKESFNSELSTSEMKKMVDILAEKGISY